MILMIFSTVRAPHDPAFTVESLAMIATGLPSRAAVPVTASAPASRTALSSSVKKSNACPAFDASFL